MPAKEITRDEAAHQALLRGIDTVGSSFANISVDGGWRRESWEMVCTPPKDSAFKRSLSVTNLTKRR